MGSDFRVSSPPSFSILMTSAPRSERIMPPRGPAWYRANSNTLMPSSDPAMRSSDCQFASLRDDPVRAAHSVGLPRIVGGIDISDVERSGGVHLNDRFAARPAIMVHPLRHVDEPAGLQRLAFLRIELVAHAKVQRAGDDRHIFIIRMHVRRYLVSGWKLQPNNERPFFSGIAVEHRELRALRERRRSGREFEAAGLRDEGLIFRLCARRRQDDKGEPQG